MYEVEEGREEGRDGRADGATNPLDSAKILWGGGNSRNIIENQSRPEGGGRGHATVKIYRGKKRK